MFTYRQAGMTAASLLWHLLLHCMAFGEPQVNITRKCIAIYGAVLREGRYEN